MTNELTAHSDTSCKASRPSRLDELYGVLASMGLNEETSYETSGLPIYFAANIRHEKRFLHVLNYGLMRFGLFADSLLDKKRVYVSNTDGASRELLAEYWKTYIDKSKANGQKTGCKNGNMPGSIETMCARAKS